MHTIQFCAYWRSTHYVKRDFEGAAGGSVNLGCVALNGTLGEHENQQGNHRHPPYETARAADRQ